MGLKERLQGDLTEAIRGRDEVTSGTIRMVLTAITNEEVSGKTARQLSDAEIVTVLSREAKKRREAAEAYDLGARLDKAALERSEGEVIAKYLPVQLSDAELQQMIKDAIAETGTVGPAGMGQVMKVLSPKIAGKADGGIVSAAVKAALSN
ncbi:MAG: GatB/YqeY domain-containing protein [Actinomycetota bacterium]